MGPMPSADGESTVDLIDHLKQHAVRTDGPFRLRSGKTSSWYVDARQSTFDGAGALLVGRAVLDSLPGAVTAVGGMTMGADPIAVATVMTAAWHGRSLRAFSVRRESKGHGTEGRVVGPVDSSDAAAVVEDTTTTGGAMFETIGVLRRAGIAVIAALALVDRSRGIVAARMSEAGIPYVALAVPRDLGVEE